MFKTKLLIANLAALLFLVIDRLFKNFFLNNPETIWDFILFKLQFWQNPGLAFGLDIAPMVMSIFLLPLTFLIVALLTWEMFKQYKYKDTNAIFFFAITILGAISNLIDRILYQKVVDYINFNFWPIFNLADTMIVIGIIGLMFNTLRISQKIKEKAEEEEEEEEISS